MARGVKRKINFLNNENPEIPLKFHNSARTNECDIDPGKC